ncbi:hypothetical protein TorRG33x02_305080, partial [Trema orientale]
WTCSQDNNSQLTHSLSSPSISLLFFSLTHGRCPASPDDGPPSRIMSLHHQGSTRHP